ncbi:conserved hypothetical protein [Uncinocarpus reesii 1704]|uniref:SAM-dependent MTase TRM10-type domain-containing protein n=1 Tax=Uncinocarpus reesii (strain UAMH 1704) TaxID=336963 RepID=C4JZJ5_UNCRE|nr:uncharacterized protein UREG_07596 [Uncinocarpus reesii 1704]EEP82731.1 conserved hypothetical protein [Uncinocarpus reesii 1704]
MVRTNETWIMAEEERPHKLQKLNHMSSGAENDAQAAVAFSTPLTDETTPEDSPVVEEQSPEPNDDKGAAAEVLEDGLAETTASQVLSKNQLKKLKQKERWEAGREWRKERRKEKMKAKKERVRAAKAQSVQGAPAASEEHEQQDRVPSGRITLRELRKKDDGRSVVLPITLLLDCDFDDLMLDKERKSLASQITRSYSDNSRSKYRAHLVVSSFNKLLKERFDTVLAKQYERWKGVTTTEDDFVQAAEAAQARMKHPKGGRLAGMFSTKADVDKSTLEEEGEIVYLSSDSPDTLTELKPYSTYIIGGLVDKNRHKGICYKRATERGIKTAKLPIGDFMQMSSRFVLATNHVVEIMLRWLELGDWGQAFDRAIPKRKGGTLKADVDDEDKKDTSNDSQGEEQDRSESGGASLPAGENIYDFEGFLSHCHADSKKPAAAFEDIKITQLKAHHIGESTVMFMLRNVSKFLFGDTAKESIIEIPQGQLYIVRPLSPKGYSELIFKDAAASIRRTGQEFQYQLVIQRAFEEGEEELADEESEGADAEGLGGDKDEKTFLLDQSLHFRSEVRDGGEKVLAWRDLSGDPGDLYEFVCDPTTSLDKVATFVLAAVQSQYERKYRQSAQKATEAQLQEFSFEEESPIPNASPVTSPVTPTSKESAAAMAKEVVTNKEKAPAQGQTQAPPAAVHPNAIEILAEETAELHLFDFNSGTFILQDHRVTATISEIGTWQYWLQISGAEREWLGQPIIADLNPVFNFEYLSFIFNHYTEDGSAYSWLLRFKDQTTEERFQEGLMQALWEHLHELKWSKTKVDERDYVLEAFNELTMEDVPEEPEEEEEEEEEEEVEEADDGQRSEHYDSDEDADDVVTKEDDGNVNSQLAVGYKHDRSFVVRGSKIGVFKHTPNNNLEFSTNISKVETSKGKLFSPKKVMLHAEDSNMILQNEQEPNTLYRMDLEYGKVVDEWKVHDDIPVTNFAPENKFSQMTSHQPFLGISRNALYRIDPRLAGNKLVDADLKQYASKNDFSVAATTEKGYIAVASNKGDVRLFDRLGINAKTHLPALGEPIIGLDVSADGRWVLATCRTYLLLIDALQKEGKNEGKLGFERAFGKDSKPQPRRLGLQPAHVAQFQHETGAPLSFTPARFNTGLDSNETSIITATGPFIITWNMKKVLLGRKDPYIIKRYAEEVKADNFKFGSDKNVIVALPNEVNMVAKQSFRKPTRESIAAPPVTPSRFGRRTSARLGRNEIVNSPY